MFAPACWSAEPPLPDSVRTSTNGAAVRDQVQKFIKDNLAKLVGDDPAAVKEAREVLVLAVTQVTPTTPAPSAQFLDVFASVLNETLLAEVKDKKPQTRLNIAVLVARVAEKANNGQLTNITVVLLDDENQGVALWAIKATKFLIPPVLGNAVAAKDNKLIPGLLAAVKKHVNRGPIVQAAYEAMKISKDGPNAVSQSSWKIVVPVVINTTLDIVEERLKLYSNGIPAWPGVEKEGISHLVSTGIYQTPLEPAMQKKLHERTVQVISNLIGIVSQRLQAAGANRQELNGLLKNAASSLLVIPSLKENDTIKKLYAISTNAPADEVIAKAQAIYPVLKQVEEFKALTPPPALSEPATTSSTQPAP
jgi:hypothetical protein